MNTIKRLSVWRDEASAQFFEAAREGRFLLRRGSNGTYLAPSSRLDPEDPTKELEWAEASGDGHLLSWIVGRARPDATGAQPIVSLGGLIALQEGPWILAPIDCDDVGALRAGLPVSATYPAPLDGEVLPVFRVS